MLDKQTRKHALYTFMVVYIVSYKI